MTDQRRRELMQRVRQKGTPAERYVASLCWSQGLKYRLNVKSLPGSPDLANKKMKWAIFVNGCFWHRHRACSKATVPKTNQAFWLEKFAANRARDASKIRLLKSKGFRVLVVWECEADSPRTLQRIASLRRRRSLPQARCRLERPHRPTSRHQPT